MDVKSIEERIRAHQKTEQDLQAEATRLDQQRQNILQQLQQRMGQITAVRGAITELQALREDMKEEKKNAKKGAK
ncbi:MAG: hypothetical protein ACXADY_23810 [Candidatus Hodarchaeales archaeon]|jgi:chromosome segregation ATPase